MTKDHLHALKKAHSHPQTNWTNAECCMGYYQNFWLQITCWAVLPPNQTSKHHHYHERFNKSTPQLFTNICNSLLDEAKQASTHLGQPFLHAAMKLRDFTEFFNIIDSCLMTYGGCIMIEEIGIHLLSLKESSHWFLPNQICMMIIKSNNTKNRWWECKYYNRNFMLLVLGWWWFWVCDLIDKLGTTFVWFLFEHCSLHPLWIRNDGMIQATVHEGGNYYNFAWGVNGTSTNNNNHANQQQYKQDRGERRRRYNENKDCALEEQNFNRNVSDIGTQEPHWS